MSQTEISRETGIPQPRISKWERGAISTSAEDTLKLVDLARKRRCLTKHPEAA